MKHTKNQLFFVAKGYDPIALGALYALKEEGFKTEVLENGAYAPQGSIALYSQHYSEDGTDHNYWTGNWPSKYLRVASHLLVHERPDWTVLTPFLVCIRPYKKNAGLKMACMELVRTYQDWYEGRGGWLLPWESAGNKHTQHTTSMEEWLDYVSQCLGRDELTEILASQSSGEHKGRGGFVVYYHLNKTGRVISDKSGVELVNTLGSNEIYQKISGFDRPVVSYGTSDLANVFELLQSIKLGHYLGIPSVFESYPGSHDWGHWRENFLNPSLEIFDAKVEEGTFGLEDQDKFTYNVNPVKFSETFKEIGLRHSAELLERLEYQPLWKMYNTGVKAVADKFMQILGIKVPYYLTTTEEILQHLGWWNRNAGEFARFVEKRAGHSVGAYNSPDRLVMSNEKIPNVDLEELHKMGWWLSGAPLYHMVYSVGAHGGLVVMVKDSTKGDVNLLSRPYLEDSKSGLYVCPVGLFRLSAEIQNEDWSIDPFVLYELLHIWKDPQEHVQKIWDNMEVPLKRSSIGTKTISKVKKSGVYIKVEN